MTKLGIIGAMDVEVETLLSEMEQVASTKKAGSTFHEGVLMGLPVVLVQCGVGKVNAALCVQIMCDCFGVTHLVNTGIAGSLCAELDIGDLVVSRDAMYHDFDCVHFGYPFGKVPGMDVIAFPADDTLLGCAFAAAEAVNPVAAALILADKTDVRRSRVRNKEHQSFDIHDRVNYAAERSELTLDPERRTLTLSLGINTEFCAVMDYFEIFLERMLLCRRAAEFLELTFKLDINGLSLL